MTEPIGWIAQLIFSIYFYIGLLWPLWVWFV